MLDLKQAVKVLKDKYPKRKAVQALDYDSSWYIIVAVENVDEVDYDSPYFAVNKSTGDIRTYSPFDDADKYSKALNKGIIRLA